MAHTPRHVQSLPGKLAHLEIVGRRRRSVVVVIPAAAAAAAVTAVTAAAAATSTVPGLCLRSVHGADAAGAVTVHCLRTVVVGAAGTAAAVTGLCRSALKRGGSTGIVLNLGTPFIGIPARSHETPSSWRRGGENDNGD